MIGYSKPGNPSLDGCVYDIRQNHLRLAARRMEGVNVQIEIKVQIDSLRFCQRYSGFAERTNFRLEFLDRQA